MVSLFTIVSREVWVKDCFEKLKSNHLKLKKQDVYLKMTKEDKCKQNIGQISKRQEKKKQLKGNNRKV